MKSKKRTCKHCGSEYEVKSLTLKEAGRRLFRWTKADWIWLVIFLLIVLSAFAYQRDMEICKEIAVDTCAYCQERREACGLTSDLTGYKCEKIDTEEYEYGCNSYKNPDVVLRTNGDINWSNIQYNE